MRNFCYRERMKRAWRSSLFCFIFWIASSLALLAMTSVPFVSLNAQEVQNKTDDKTVVYAPKGCDFQLTFPEEPYETKRCAPHEQGQINQGRNCQTLTSYTMVYDMRTTVDVSVSCMPSTPEQFEKYNEHVMRAALGGIVARRDVEDYKISFQEKEGIRQAALSGSGTSGRSDKIFIAQIWAAQNSLLTVQAELIGPEHPQADTVYKDILKSIRVKK